jgi:hypothetical protein
MNHSNMIRRQPVGQRHRGRRNRRTHIRAYTEVAQKHRDAGRWSARSAEAIIKESQVTNKMRGWHQAFKPPGGEHHCPGTNWMPQPKQHRFVACESVRKSNNTNGDAPMWRHKFMPNYLTPGIHLGKAGLENPTEKYATQQMRQSCSNQATEVWC